MKKLMLLLSLSVIAFSTVYSQSDKKLVVMITRAKWCPTCKANEGKINNELIPVYASSKKVEVVINDISNKRTKEKSKPVLESANVYGIAKEQMATGTILLIDPSTGKILSKLYVSDPVDELKRAIELASNKI
jgi:hypothetical protein